MLTLAFSMFVWAVAFKWRSVTGGDDGFVGVAIPAFIDGRVPFYYFALTIVSISVVLVVFALTLMVLLHRLTTAGGAYR